MKTKYVEERFPEWFVTHGQIRVSGSVELSTIDNGNAAYYGVRRGEAEEMVAEHNRAIAMLARLADALDKADPAAFKAIWYGPETADQPKEGRHG